MGSSARVISGSLSKGSTAINIGSESASVDLALFKQGHNINTLNDLTAGVSLKIRSSSGLKRILKNRPINTKYFDDTLSPIFVKGSSAEISSPAVAGRFETVVTHDYERRDLGQTDFYDDGLIFTELANPDNPIEVINVVNRGRALPAALVDNTSVSSFAGKIDVMNIVKSTDRSSTDFPYESRGVHGNFGHDQDFLRRSSEIEDKTVTPGSNKQPTAPYYLDAPENFGDVLMPSVLNFNDFTIKPFNDVAGDIEQFVNTSGNLTDSRDGDIKAVILRSSFTVDDARGTFDRMTVGGFDYEGGNTDSIVYGGLKR